MKIKIFDIFIDGIKKILTLPFSSENKNYDNENYRLKKELVQTKWQEIKELTRLGGPSRLKQAIIEADKLLDQSLKMLGAQGETFAERLKNAKNEFGASVYEDLWQAHKLRNEIVHGEDREILSSEVNDALLKFENAFKDLGIL